MRARMMESEAVGKASGLNGRGLSIRGLRDKLKWDVLPLENLDVLRTDAHHVVGQGDARSSDAAKSGDRLHPVGVLRNADQVLLGRNSRDRRSILLVHGRVLRDRYSPP